MPHDVDLDRLSTRRLLLLYADLLTELVRRGVVRSRNAPAGDLAEYLALQVYGGELAPPSEKSWDVRAGDGRVIQVKSRLIAASDRRSHTYSPFRSWDFHACLFLVLDAHTYAVVSAVEVPVDAVRALARATPHVNGHRVTTRTPLADLPGAADRTAELRHALAALDAPPTAP
jgi:hypothetical protein